MKILEIWQKGHPNKNQVMQIFKNGLKGKATIKYEDNSVIAEMYFHDFIDTFTTSGTSDKLLNLLFKFDQEWNKDITSQESMIIRRKLSKYFDKIYNIAIKNSRSLIPLGWMLNTNFSNYGITSLQNKKIKLKIDKDYNEEISKVDTYYHFTLSKFLPDILKNGLLTKSNTRIGFQGYRNRIYLFNKDPRIVDHEILIALVSDTNMIFKLSDGTLNTDVAILKIKLPDNVKTYKDPEYSSYGVYIEENIPVNNIRVDFNGKLKDLLE